MYGWRNISREVTTKRPQLDSLAREVRSILNQGLQPVKCEAYFTGPLVTRHTPLVTAAKPLVWLEKYFSRGDYRRQVASSQR
jgi:hypothetical protein